MVVLIFCSSNMELYQNPAFCLLTFQEQKRLNKNMYQVTNQLSKL